MQIVILSRKMRRVRRIEGTTSESRNRAPMTLLYSTLFLSVLRYYFTEKKSERCCIYLSGKKKKTC